MADGKVDPQELAEKIARKAATALAPLDVEIASWPAEFKQIMWQAVAVTATAYAKEATGA